MSLFQWAVIALVISLGAGTLGYGGMNHGTAVVARGFFGIFLAISLVLLVMVVMGIGAVSGL
ncbi:DUF1328 domain-containing protein [bacterium]|nr:MAG: DUF1328 domain-containing protein [bacterium]